MIKDTAELARKAQEAGQLLQEVTDYLLKHPQHEKVGRVRFPRGFLRTASTHRTKFPWVEDQTLRRNLSYALMTHDALRWVVFHTDIAGQARDMLIKEGVCILAAVCEGVTIFAGERNLGRQSSFAKRINRLVEIDVIEEEIGDELNWLWSLRANEHLYDVKGHEWDLYSHDDWTRSVTVYKKLVDALALWRVGGWVFHPPF